MGRLQSLSKLLSAYRPKPGPRFYQKMRTAPWQPASRRFALRIRLGWQLLAAGMLLLLLLGLSIPPVRAALSAWLGLSVAPADRMPASVITLAWATPLATAATPSPMQPQVAATPTVVTQVPSQVSTSTVPAPTLARQAGLPTRSAEIDGLSPQAGWGILLPARLPDGYRFESAYLDTNHHMVILTYLVTRPLPGAADPSLTASQTITLLQALTNDFVPLQLAPSAVVTDVQVDGQAGVYLIGAWDTQYVPDDKDPQGGQMVSTWRNDLPIKNLYWQVGKVYLAIIATDELLSQQDLVAMGASVSGP